MHVKLGSYQNPFEKISMTWKLAEFGNINNQYHFSESRPGIAAKGEPSVVLRTWWFDKREERDAFLASRHAISTGQSPRPEGGMCTSCASARKNCAVLDFETMQIIGTDDRTGAKIVRCTDYVSDSLEKKTDFLAVGLRAT